MTEKKEQTKERESSRGDDSDSGDETIPTQSCVGGNPLEIRTRRIRGRSNRFHLLLLLHLRHALSYSISRGRSDAATERLTMRSVGEREKSRWTRKFAMKRSPAARSGETSCAKRGNELISARNAFCRSSRSARIVWKLAVQEDGRKPVMKSRTSRAKLLFIHDRLSAAWDAWGVAYEWD